MSTRIIQALSSYICNGAVFLAMNYFPKYQIRCIPMILGCIVDLIPAALLYRLRLTALHSRLASLYMSYFYLGPYIVSLWMNTANTA